MSVKMKSHKDTLVITFKSYFPFIGISRREQIDLAIQPWLRIGYATRTVGKRLKVFYKS